MNRDPSALKRAFVGEPNTTPTPRSVVVEVGASLSLDASLFGANESAPPPLAAVRKNLPAPLAGVPLGLTPITLEVVFMDARGVRSFSASSRSSLARPDADDEEITAAGARPEGPPSPDCTIPEARFRRTPQRFIDPMRDNKGDLFDKAATAFDCAGLTGLALAVIDEDGTAVVAAGADPDPGGVWPEMCAMLASAPRAAADEGDVEPAAIETGDIAAFILGRGGGV